MILSFSYSSTVNAALSATTVKTIQGTEPRLSSALETEIANQSFSRFGFTYNGTNYDTTNISSFPKLAPGTATPASIKALITGSTLNTTLLSSGDALDSDGDNNFTLVGLDNSNMPIASTALTIKIKDNANNDITTSTTNFCDLASTNPGPYKIEISNNLRLTTQYGDPIKKDYTTTTVETSLKQPSKQYQFALETGVCEVQPNPAQNYTGNADWTGTGFKVISTTNGSLNFPTTGFNGAFFKLKIAGVDVTTLTFPPVTEGNITATVSNPTSSTDTITVTLRGPSQDTAKGGLGPYAFIAPTNDIEIKDNTNKISYKFKVTQWFIPKSGNGNGYAAVKAYCENTLAGGGNQYRVPTRADYTNNPMVFLSNCQGNGSDSGTCQGGTYTRAIGGGLFAEWGYTWASYYASSDWEINGYWASEAFSGSNQYLVTSYDGNVFYNTPSGFGVRAACVMP